MKEFLNNRSNQYVLIFFLYVLISVVVGKSIVLSVMMWLFTFMSIYYFVYASVNYKLPRVLKVFNIFTLLLAAYGLVLMFSEKQLIVTQGQWRIVDNGLYIKQITRFLLPLNAFYVFAKRGLLTKHSMRVWFFAFLALQTLLFFNRASYLSETSHGDIGVTNNDSYDFIALIPLCIFVMSKKKWQIPLLLYCLVFIILGGKRGAIVCGAVAIVIYFYFQIKRSSTLAKLGTMLVAGGVVVALFFVFNWVLDANQYFFIRIQRILEGDYGHRSDLYATFWNHFLHESNPWRQLFGNGADATLEIYDNYAHNDWLELLINQGVVGVAIYAVLFYYLFNEYRYQPEEYKMVYLIVVLIWFTKSLFSMGYRTLPIFELMLLGYLLANRMSATIKKLF